MTLEQIAELFGGETPPETVIMNGYDHCILGVCDTGQQEVIAYDWLKVIKQNMTDGSTYQEAIDFFYHNQGNNFPGPGAPCFVTVTTEMIPASV